MMNHLRRAAQWAGGVGMSEAPDFLNKGGKVGGNVADRLTRGPQDRAALSKMSQNSRLMGAGEVSPKGGSLNPQQRLQRRGVKRIASVEGTRQLMGIGPLTIGGSSGSSGIEPKSSGAVGLPPPRSSGGMQY